MIGVEVDAAAVGLHYGGRESGGLLDAWVVDTADAGAVEEVRRSGLPGVATDLMMREPADTAAFILEGVEWYEALRAAR
jgi:LPPG:FO 2-phospho-L-lactate transferase